MDPIQEVQVEPEAPVTEPAQVVETTPPVTEIKETETPKNEAAIPQSEWQRTQERLRTVELQNSRLAVERFEAENPIVKTEKYSKQWEEVKKLKETPGHRYSGLDYNELLNLIRDHSYQPEIREKQIPVPSLNPSAAPDVPNGELSQTVTDWLSIRYTKDQIAAAKR
jgi:hypothetical protein